MNDFMMSEYDQMNDMQPDMYGMRGMNGINNNMPMPMDIFPSTDFSNLSPSMMPPQFGPSEQTNSYYGQNIQPHYATGGHVEPYGLGRMAEDVREQGEGEDTILAHIHPLEAQELEQKYGSSINPETGLPQYGRFLKGIGKALQKAAPFIGSLAGNAIAGPAGGMIGGGLGGALSGKKGLGGEKALDRALVGGAIGAGTSYLAPKMGSMMGISPEGLGGQALGMGKPGFGDQFGGLAKGLGFGAGEGPEGKGKGVGSLFSGDNLNKLLLGTALLGTLAGKRKQAYGPQDMPRNYRLKEQKMNAIPANYSGGIGPEMSYFDNNNPQLEYYAHGGRAEPGYFEGVTDGTADKIPAMLSDGEFVVKAAVVSGLGNGNNKAGAKKLEALQENVMKHQYNTKKSLPPKAKTIASYFKGAK